MLKIAWEIDHRRINFQPPPFQIKDFVVFANYSQQPSPRTQTQAIIMLLHVHVHVACEAATTVGKALLLLHNMYLDVDGGVIVVDRKPGL